MGDDSNDRVKVGDGAASDSNGLAKEATENLPEQLERAKEKSQALKTKEKTGITDDFGKPTIEGETDPLKPITAADTKSYRARTPGEPGDQPTITKMKFEPEVVIVAYPGETINRDVEPSVVTAKKGQTLKEIAKDHLGAGASEEEIQKHAKEIAHVNGIKNPNAPLGERELSLPGHTKAGGFITKDEAGNKRTKMPNGDIHVDNANGTRSVRSTKEDGSYSEQHYGPRPEDNYYVGRTADGKYQVADGGPEGDVIVTPVYDAKDNDPRAERAKLNDIAEATIKNPKELARFRADMVKFDARSKELEETYKKQGLNEVDAHKKAQEEIGKTYKQIGKLLEENPSATLEQKKRVQIAEQVMHQAADPTEVDQGSQGTCNVATVESRAYAVNPSEAARLVTDVATTGKYKSNTGTEVTLDKKDLEAFGESKKNPPEEGSRGYASQIFQVTAINIHYSREHSKGGEDIRYRQQEPKPGAKPDPDNGERLWDYKDPKKPVEVLGENGKGKRTPGLSDEQIVAVSQEIVTGDKKLPDGTPGPVLLQNDSAATERIEREITFKQSAVDRQAKYCADVQKIYGVGDGTPLNPNDPVALQKAKEAIDSAPKLDPEYQKKYGGDPELREKMKKDIDELVKKNSELERMKLYGDSTNGVVNARDEKQFEAVIAKAKAEGRLPIIVHVYSYHDPFSAQSGGSAGDQGGAHVVNVTDYHPAEAGPPAKAARVSVDNQWGTPNDFNNDRGMPVADLFKASKMSPEIHQLESLKAQKETNSISAADYDKEVGKLMLDAERRWKKEDAAGTYSKSEHDRLVKFWRSELSTLKPPSRSEAIIKKLGEDCKSEGLNDKKKESIDPLEELKAKKKSKSISDADYDKEVGKLMLDAEKRWDKERKAGTYSKREHDQFVDSWLDEVKTLKPPSRSQEITSKLNEDCKKEGLNQKMRDSIQPLEELKAKRESKSISDADYDKELAEKLIEAERRWNKEEMDGTYSKEEHDRYARFWLVELASLKPPSRVDAISKKVRDDCKKEGLTDPSQRHS